jgi:hypothetical protein
MKKYIYIGIGIVLVGLVVWWRVASASIVVVDSYSESNWSIDRNVGISLGGGFILITGYGQVFSVSGTYTLDSCKFYLSKVGSPSNNITASIYAVTGSPKEKPTGSALATSDSIDVSSFGSSDALVTFSFSGANRIQLTTGDYAVVVNDTVTSATDYLNVGADDTSPTHAKNETAKINGVWSDSPNVPASDVIFYVYGDNGGGTPVIVSGSGQKMLMSMTY